MKSLIKYVRGFFFFSLFIIGMGATNSFSQAIDFEKRKTERLSEIDQHIQKMQEWRKSERAEHRDNKLGKRGQPNDGPAL